MVIVAEQVHYVINGSVVNPFLKGKQGNLFNVGREANSGKGIAVCTAFDPAAWKK